MIPLNGTPVRIMSEGAPDQLALQGLHGPGAKCAVALSYLLLLLLTVDDVTIVFVYFLYIVQLQFRSLTLHCTP